MCKQGATFQYSSNCLVMVLILICVCKLFTCTHQLIKTSFNEATRSSNFVHTQLLSFPSVSAIEYTYTIHKCTNTDSSQHTHIKQHNHNPILFFQWLERSSVGRWFHALIFIVIHSPLICTFLNHLWYDTNLPRPTL